MWRELFMNDADHALAQATYERLSPQPIGMVEAELDLRRFYEPVEAGRLRCSYLNATDDISLPPGPRNLSRSLRQAGRGASGQEGGGASIEVSGTTYAPVTEHRQVSAQLGNGLPGAGGVNTGHEVERAPPRVTGFLDTALP